MPDFLSSRRHRTVKKQGVAGVSRQVAPAVDETDAADLKTSDGGTPTAPEQLHRPWLVPGAGKL